MRKKDEAELVMSFVCGIETNDWKIGREIFRQFGEANHYLLPDKIGNSEPLKVTVSDIEDCAPFWAPLDDVSRGGIAGNADNFMWKRSRKIRSSGHIMHRFRNRAGEVRATWLVFRADPERATPWKNLFAQLCILLAPKYATLHILGSMEKDSSRFSAEDIDSFGFNDHVTGLPPIALERKGLANLACSNFFGTELTHLLDVKKIERAGFPIRQLGDGHMLEISPDLFLVLDDFAAFADRRTTLKGLFPENTFRIALEPRYSD